MLPLGACMRAWAVRAVRCMGHGPRPTLLIPRLPAPSSSVCPSPSPKPSLRPLPRPPPRVCVHEWAACRARPVREPFVWGWRCLLSRRVDTALRCQEADTAGVTTGQATGSWQHAGALAAHACLPPATVPPVPAGGVAEAAAAAQAISEGACGRACRAVRAGKLGLGAHAVAAPATQHAARWHESDSEQCGVGNLPLYPCMRSPSLPPAFAPLKVAVPRPLPRPLPRPRCGT